MDTYLGFIAFVDLVPQLLLLQIYLCYIPSYPKQTHLSSGIRLGYKDITRPLDKFGDFSTEEPMSSFSGKPQEKGKMSK